MAITADGVTIQIDGDSTGLKKSVDEAAGIVKQKLGDMDRAARDAVAAFMSFEAIKSLAGLTKQAIDAAGALQDLSVKTGISASTLSGYEYAAKMSGASIDTVANGLKKLSTNMVEANTGNKEAQATFKALGISVTDTNGVLRSNDAVMRDVADRFEAMPEGAEKSAMAVRLFGKAGSDMIPMLNDGSKGLDEMRATAEALGLVISDDTAAAMESLGDKLDTTQLAGQGLARQLAANVTPALTAVADSFIDGAKNGGLLKGAVDVLGFAFKGLVSIGYGVLGTFQALGTGLGGLMAIVYEVMQGNFKAAKDIAGSLGGDMVKAFTQYDKDLQKVWSNEVAAQKNVQNEHKKTRATLAELNTEKAKHIKVSQLEKEQVDRLKDAHAELWKELDKSAKATADYYLDSLAGLQPFNVELEQEIRNIENETRALTASKEELREVAVQRALEKANIDKLNPAYEEYARRIREALLKKDEVADQIKASDDIAAGWKKAGEDIERALTDALMRGFDSGKDFASSLVDYVKNAFKSTVIKVALSATGLTASNFAAAGQGASGGFANAGGFGGFDATSMLGNLTGVTGLGAGILGMGQAMGSGMIANFGAGMYAGATGGFSAAGAVMGNAGAMSSAGIGSAIGAAMPYIAAGLAIYSLYKSIVGKSTPHVGGFGEVTESGQLLGGASSSLVGTRSGWGRAGGKDTVNEDAVKASQNLAAGVSSLLNGFSQLYGDGKRYGVATGFADDSSSDGAWGALKITAGGQKVLDWADTRTSRWAPKEFSDGEAGQKQYMAALGTSVRQVIDGMALPAWASDFLDKLGAAPTLESLSEALTQIAAVQGVVEGLGQLGGIFSKMASSGGDAVIAIAGLVGGIDQLIAKSQAFVGSYYSESEQAAMTARGIVSTLTAAGIDSSTLFTKNDLRGLLESLDPSKSGDQEKIAAILNIAPEFAKIAGELGNGSLQDLAKLAPEIAALTPVVQESVDIQAEANAATASAIEAMSNSIVSGTNATVAAINAMGSTVANAVSSAMITSTSATAALQGSIDKMVTDNRLAAAAPVL